MLLEYKKYLIRSFCVNIVKISLVFSIIIIIMNLLEEISFLKNFENTIYLSIKLTLLNLPSVLFEILPFIFLISTIFFFIEISNYNEIEALKSYGVTNLDILGILSAISFFLGVLIIIFFYSISSNLKFIYLETKNLYSKDNKYLSIVTSNGLWIRDIVDNQLSFINADKIIGDKLINVTITQYDENFDLKKVISSEEAIIVNKTWELKRLVINSNGNSKKREKLKFKTNYDKDLILSIFENFSSLSLIEISKLKKKYDLLGYNTDKINAYNHKIFSYPIYLTLMTIIGIVLMSNNKKEKSKWIKIFIGVIISVVIYYINYFFNVIIETLNVPYIISIWGPLMVLGMIVTLSLLRLNEK
jgi:lipopolysaccharide export system permease protein